MKKSINFKTCVPLHVHTAKGSVGDSILKIKEYVKKAKDMGLKSLAVTNHGSMADMFEFYQECINNDIKPIIGCEIYETKDRLIKEKTDENKYWHLVLIAKNEIGLKNLLYITSDAQLNGFYYKPRTDISVLKEHGEGLICLSACLGGKIPQYILENKEDILMQRDSVSSISDILQEEVQYESKVIEAIEEYKNIFDEFYLEIQPGNFEDQRFVNECLMDLAEGLDIPLVVTNDIHYLDEKDWYAHDIHLRINRKMKLEGDPIYPDRCYYLQDYDTIKNSLSYINDKTLMRAINNTMVISSHINLKLSNNLFMPKYDVEDEASYLTKICYERLEEMQEKLKDPSEYATRLQYELDTIIELGFAGYFLTVKDFIDHARGAGIPVGPGRGSVCGSLVSFLTGISVVDPIKYNLLFERFLSVHRRGSIPDIDTDFSSERRQEMFDYVVNKHGKDKCALVSTFGIRKARASLRDTARVFDIPAEIADEAAKLIPQVYYDDAGEKMTDLSIEDSLQFVPRLKALQEEYKEWFDLAIKLEDLPKHTSIHAAGTIISPVTLQGYIPLVKPNSEFINATALNLKDAEAGGLTCYRPSLKCVNCGNGQMIA